MPLRELLWNYILHAAIQTVLEVSADHITSLSCSSSLSPSNKKALFMLHTVSIRISITQSIRCVWTLNSFNMFQDCQKVFRQSSSDGIVQFRHANGQDEILNWMKGWVCAMLCNVWWACLRSASLDSMPSISLHVGMTSPNIQLSTNRIMIFESQKKNNSMCSTSMLYHKHACILCVVEIFLNNVIKHFVILCLCSCQ